MAGIILCTRPATDRQCYNVTLSLIGWAHTQNWYFEWNLISEMGQCYKVWLKGKLATYRRHVSRGTIILAELGAEVTKMLTTNYWDHQQNKNIILQKLLVFIMAKFACVNYKTQGLLCIKKYCWMNSNIYPRLALDGNIWHKITILGAGKRKIHNISWQGCSDMAYECLLAVMKTVNKKTSKLCIHDDVIKWKHFPHYWPFVWGIHRSPVNSPHKGQWRGTLMFTLICARINGWVNNCEAGDLRRNRAHSDVIVMLLALCEGKPLVTNGFPSQRASTGDQWIPLSKGQ